MVVEEDHFTTNTGADHCYRITLIPHMVQQEVVGLFGLIIDVSESKKVENDFKLAQSVAKIGSWHNNHVVKQLSWTDEIYNILGLEKQAQEASTKLFLSCVHPDDVAELRTQYESCQETDRSYSVQYRIVRPESSEIRWVQEIIIRQANESGDLVRSYGTIQDITTQKQAQDEMQRMAMTDQLTGLANRNQFNQRFEDTLKLAKRHDWHLVLLLVDLDKFKPINDTYGHLAGDAVLKIVSTRLLEACRETDVVARLGGDEFGVLLLNPLDMRAVEEISQRILDSLQKPMKVEGVEVHVGCSIGISHYPDHATTQDDLFQKADLALYHVKNTGRNRYAIYAQDHRMPDVAKDLA